MPIRYRNPPEAIVPTTPRVCRRAEPSTGQRGHRRRAGGDPGRRGRRPVEWPSANQNPTETGRLPSAMSLRVVLSMAAMWSASKAWRMPSVYGGDAEAEAEHLRGRRCSWCGADQQRQQHPERGDVQGERSPRAGSTSWPASSDPWRHAPGGWSGDEGRRDGSFRQATWSRGRGGWATAGRSSDSGSRGRGAFPGPPSQESQSASPRPSPSPLRASPDSRRTPGATRVVRDQLGGSADTTTLVSASISPAPCLVLQRLVDRGSGGEVRNPKYTSPLAPNTSVTVTRGLGE